MFVSDSNEGQMSVGANVWSRASVEQRHDVFVGPSITRLVVHSLGMDSPSSEARARSLMFA